jgi:hypothetical protein
MINILRIIIFDILLNINKNSNINTFKMFESIQTLKCLKDV